MSEIKRATTGVVVRVLAAESTRMATQFLLEALKKDSRFSVVGLLTTPEAFAAGVRDFEPEVAVIGISGNGHARQDFGLVRRTVAQRPGLQVITILESSASELVVEAFRCGARGVICRDDGLDSLCKCVDAVYHGQVWANSSQLGYLLQVFSSRWVPETIVDSNGRSLLSKRELDVVRCVSEGMTNRDIASQLDLSEHTVKNYLFRAFDKLGVSSRTELILYAMNHSCTTHSPAANVEQIRCEHCSVAARIAVSP